MHFRQKDVRESYHACLFPYFYGYKIFKLAKYLKFILGQTVYLWLPVMYKLEYYRMVYVWYIGMEVILLKGVCIIFLLYSVFRLQQVDQRIFMFEKKIWKWHNL